MLDQLVLWEKSLFLWLNSPHTPYLDAFMFLISAHWTWASLLIALIAWLFVKHSPKEAFFFILFAALLITCCDQLTSGLIKPLCERARPTHHLFTKDVVKSVYNDLGGGFGFVSGHAANFFAFSLFTALTFRNRLFTILIFIVATTVAYSRIYLGMHFVTDVVPGALIGLLLGWLFFKLYSWLRIRWRIAYHAPGSTSQNTQAGTLKKPCMAFGNTMPYLNVMVACFLFFLAFFAMAMARAIIRIGYYA